MFMQLIEDAKANTEQEYRTAIYLRTLKKKISKTNYYLSILISAVFSYHFCFLSFANRAADLYN